MIINNLNRKTIISFATVGYVILTTGCSLINDDLEPCPKELRLSFKQDYLKETDAFKAEVNSINIWAFDPEGHPVWSGIASGPELKEVGFYLTAPLKEGKYDFVAWCGLKDNENFELATYTPVSKTDLEVKLKTIEEDGKHISRSHLQGLYHGMIENVDFTAHPAKPTVKDVTVSLMKDTKDIRIMLQHLDGSEIENKDFSVSITDGNGEYAWNNTLISSETVTYTPWNVKYGIVTAPDGERQKTRDITTVASLMFELSTGRLMTDSKAVLTVHRNWDDRDIIRIPLIDYLLLIRGYYSNISDQEYLDLQDDYSIVFFIDPASNWYLAAGIYINGWAVVPPQSQPL